MWSEYIIVCFCHKINIEARYYFCMNSTITAVLSIFFHFGSYYRGIYLIPFPQWVILNYVPDNRCFF